MAILVIGRMFILPIKKILKLIINSILGAGVLYVINIIGANFNFHIGLNWTADLYKAEKISREEACYLLTFSNYPGPSFLSSYLCISIFKRRDLIPYTYGILYVSAFLCSLIFRPKASPAYLSRNLSHENKETSSSHQLMELLDVSIMNGFEAVTKLGAKLFTCF